jgi:arsenate reductase
MYKKLESTIEDLIDGFDDIPSARKRSLEEIARFVNKEIHSSGGVEINFICTHNSRRSQMAQIWTKAAAEHYDLKGVETFSGGVETTEFNPRAVDAIKRAGFRMRKSGDDNPEYHIRYGKGEDSLVCYSKTFNDPTNPSDNFAAILTCSDADEKCPIVPGAEYRQLISYDDPKEADGTDKEEKVYDERCIQIGTEMFYMMSKAGSSL